MSWGKSPAVQLSLVSPSLLRKRALEICSGLQGGVEKSRDTCCFLCYSCDKTWAKNLYLNMV